MTTPVVDGDALRDGGRLTLAEAMVSPCESCAEVPCCQYLPLHTFTVETLRDVDYVGYLLNFDGIEVGINASGTWSAYYRAACRFLGAGGRCGLHGTPQKPHICVQYDPYSCWYRPALVGEGNGEYLRVDRARFDAIGERLRFDDRRRIVDLPLWDDLEACFATMPIVDRTADADAASAAATPAFDQWRAVALGRKDGRPRPPVAAQPDVVVSLPCDTCTAPCCTTLLFPATPPLTASNLDYLRFALGFPGVEVIAGDDAWQLALQTTCRHHVDGRCSLYGDPMRPLRCQFLDAWTCAERPTFDVVPAVGVTRFRLEELPAVLGCFSFDDAGLAVEIPTAERLRASIEASWA